MLDGMGLRMGETRENMDTVIGMGLTRPVPVPVLFINM